MDDKNLMEIPMDEKKVIVEGSEEYKIVDTAYKKILQGKGVIKIDT